MSCPPSNHRVRSNLALLALLLASSPGCDRDPVPTAPTGERTTPASEVAAFDGIRLHDASEASGLAAIRTTSGTDPSTRILEVKGGGLGLVDFDADGDLDLLVPNGATLDAPADGPGARLLRNLAVETGTLRFEDATSGSGLEDHRAWSFGVAAGDVDGDGLDDLVVGTLGVDRLWLNDGEGGFRDATAAWGLDDATGWTTSPGLGDLDGDGDLDLVAVEYLDFDPAEPAITSTFRGIEVLAGPRGLRPRRDRWYENVGDRFERREIEADPRYGLNLVILDFDGDGLQDVLVGNDSQGNQFHRNLGDWRFEEIGVRTGAATNGEGDAQATMGMAVADVDGDATPDVFSTNFSSDTNTLHVNREGFFDDRTRRLGIATGSRPQLGWATEFVDFDHDGDEDVLVLNGHVYPQASIETMDSTYAQPPGLWRRDGDRFAYVDPEAPESAAMIEANPWLRAAHRDRAAVFADLDLDGDVDVVVVELNGPLRLLENRHDRTDDWVVVRPVPAAGAEVVLRDGDRVQRRWIRGGGPFQSTASPEAHFGLGTAPGGPMTVEVRWPDGVVRTVDVEPGARVTVERNSK